MKRNVHIRMESRQSTPGEDALPVLLNTEGTWYYRDGSHYLLFEEPQEDGSGPVRSRMRIRQEHVDLKRQGSVETHFFFSPGQEHRADYVTPYGSIPLKILTDTLVVSGEEKRLCVEIGYRIQTADGAFLTCRVLLSAEASD